MTTPTEADFAWPPSTPADLRKLLEHHAADVLREAALALGIPGWELITRGEVATYLQGRAEHLDGCTQHNAFGDGPLVCREHGPHRTHVFAATGADDRHTSSEAVHD